MATTSTLTTINVFDSEDSYNANKNNIGENEISLVGLINNLVPVGVGIVAANLAQNGYVKFSNGLILQWGITGSVSTFEYTDVTFPIAFSSACYGCVASVQTGDSQARQSGNCRSYSTTNARVGNVYGDASSDGKISWFAYGK